MRKIIKIFLASSITEFAGERMVIENFIRNVSDKFEEHYNVKIQPLLCENVDDVYTVSRKQEEYNELIRGSEMCFFIFFTRAGEYTREEFEVARKQFEQTGSPKIYTYFKIIKEGEAEQSLLDFMDELDKVFGHYYGTFEHVDTIKLRILLSLKLREMDFLEIKAEDGKCVVDGSEVMSLENVSEFANNKSLTALQEELKKTEEEYFRLKPVYAKGGCDSEFYSRYSKIAAKRQNLIDEIEELQRLIFNVSMRMSRDETHGEVSPRQKEAYRLFELGDYEGCIAVLDSEDIDNDFLRARRKIKEQDIAVCRKYIREHKTAIDILSAMTGYTDRFAEIESRYEKIIPVIFEQEIELDTAREYASYLNNQTDDAKALSIAERLLELYTDFDEEMAKVLNLAGIICDYLNFCGKSEEYFLKAIAVYENLAEEKPEEFIKYLAMSYNNIGIFYKQQGQPDKAEEYYLKAIDIKERLAEENGERHNSDLVISYNNAGNFYKEQGKTDKAENYYRRAVALSEWLAEEDTESFNTDLATSYNNAGLFYSEQNLPEKAEEYHLKAIAIREKLAEENPERFNADLAASYNNAGNFYNAQCKADKAEEYYVKAIVIRELLAGKNPERFNAELSTSYNNAGFFYMEQGQADRAEDYYLKAIDIRVKLAEENPERFNPDIADSYNNIGILYSDGGRPDKAEEYYSKAAVIYEKLAEKNPERFNADLANCYNNLGTFYHETCQYGKSEEFFLKAMVIRGQLANENPGRFNPDLADSYNNVGVFYMDQGQPDKAEQYYLKALDIREKLAEENPERFKADLATSYSDVGVFYMEQGQADMAEEYYLKAIDIGEKLAEENPERFSADLAVSYYNFALLKDDKNGRKKALELAKKAPWHPLCKEIIQALQE